MPQGDNHRLPDAPPQVEAPPLGAYRIRMADSPPPDSAPAPGPDPTPNPSLKDERSEQPYNEQKARDAFGDAFVDMLKAKQHEFRGDWWQLAKLVTNLEADKKTPDINPGDRLKDWNTWRANNNDENIHLEGATLVEAHLEGANLQPVGPGLPGQSSMCRASR